MASIRYRAPWRVIVNGKTDPKGPFASEKQAQAYAATLVAQGIDEDEIKVNQERSGTWEVRIRRQGGKVLIKSFLSKKMATDWADQREGEIVNGSFVDTRAADKTTVGELLQRYADTCTKPGEAGSSDRYRLQALQRLDLAKLRVSSLQTMHIAAFRDAELKRGLKPASVIKSLELMSRVLNIAHSEWGVRLPINPASAREVRRPKLGEDAHRKRTLKAVHLIPNAEDVGRRVAHVSGDKRLKVYEERLARCHSEGVRLVFHPDVAPLLALRTTEYCALLRSARYPHWFEPRREDEIRGPLIKPGVKARDRSSNCRIWAIECFGVETAMRRGEMTKLEWSHVDLEEGCLNLPSSITKNGHSRCVPLTLRALRILRTQPRVGPRVFNTTADSIKRAYKLVLARVGAHNLRFHDLRHEATTRLVQGTTMSPLLIGQITGHRDPRMLAHYYNPTANEIVKTFRASWR